MTADQCFDLGRALGMQLRPIEAKPLGEYEGAAHALGILGADQHVLEDLDGRCRVAQVFLKAAADDPAAHAALGHRVIGPAAHNDAPWFLRDPERGQFLADPIGQTRHGIGAVGFDEEPDLSTACVK